MGALMMHFMLETIFAAQLWGIDAFDQPAVEEGKVLTRQYLSATAEVVNWRRDAAPPSLHTWSTDRRRRGGRAAGQRREGAGRERDRRRRAAHRRHPEGGRPHLPLGGRRRHRHERRRSSQLAVERHCTSKLPDDDLTDIRTLGFRGEALPSIASVSRFTITSRPAGADTAWSLAIDGGAKGEPRPAAHPPGTRVEVRDLFFATPARLKFLKEPRTESGHVADAMRRLAMAHPAIAFRLESEERTLIDLPAANPSLLDKADAARLERLAAIMGREFADNALAIDANREGFRLTGFAGLPTLNRPTSQHQYLFVNGRPVRDKLLAGAVRGAYQDFLARDRHPMVALFLEAPPEMVDVNVHPAKTEVRFRDAGIVRGLIVGALRTALAAAGHRASTTVSDAALGAFRPHTGYSTPLPMGEWLAARSIPRGLAEAAVQFMAPLDRRRRASRMPTGEIANGITIRWAWRARSCTRPTSWPQTDEGVVIVDQHAAHERLLHEKLKNQLEAEGVKRQALLLPEVVESARTAPAA